MPTSGSDAQFASAAKNLIASYPHDPRLHFTLAMGAIDQNDPARAAEEARLGLHDMERSRPLLQPIVEAGLWHVLGLSEARRGLTAEAEQDYGRAAAIDPQLAGLDFDQAKLRFALGRYDQALPLAQRSADRHPTFADAWRLLGSLQFARGDIEAALTAFQRERDLTSSPSSFRMTGLTRFYSGDPKGALLDLQRGSEKGRVGYYSALWLDIVSERDGKPSTLDASTLVPGDQLWPAPVIQMFQGILKPDDLRRDAVFLGPNPGMQQACEADVYISEWDLIHGPAADAEPGFRKAVTECPPEFVERWMATAEPAGDAGKAP